MRFNFGSKQGKRVHNFEGGVAYKMPPTLELYTSVVTAGLDNKFYETASERLQRIRALIAKNDPEFVAKLAIYTRSQMHMRSIPLVLAVELAKIHSGDSLISRTVGKVVQRADEITELLAYYQMANQRKGTKKLNKLSKQLQKGLSTAFNNFDEYQFAKYNRAAEVKMKDALFLVHPKAKNEGQQMLFNKIVQDSLEVPYTWETELSALGQNGFMNQAARDAAFRTQWESLIESGRMGYMAMLRNLRNILEANVSAQHLYTVSQRLGDPVAVQRSKQLPFRFLAAYREVKPLASGKSAHILQALENAIAMSAANIKGFDDNVSVVIACDVSGSMQRSISARSKIMNYDIGLVLGMLLQSRCKDVITGMFGDTWKVINVPPTNILSNVEEFYRREGEVGYSTNGYKVVQDLINRKKVVDKVMMFTDCQMWDSHGNQSISKLWSQYKTIAPNAKIYLFDLAGYGNTPLNVDRKDVFLISGWSDKIFGVLDAIENGSDAVSEIKKIEL